MSEKRTIGTCSICGGPVTQYTYLLIVGPWPAPRCEQCGGCASGGPWSNITDEAKAMAEGQEKSLR